MAVFVLTKRSNGESQFNLKSSEGTTLLMSEGYTTKANCLNGVESVKKNSTEANRYELKESSNGKFFFNLKASNGQVIGTSPMFETEALRQSCIDTVKESAASATSDDQL